MATITLKNASNPNLAEITVDAVVDPTVQNLCIPEGLASQLGFTMSMYMKTVFRKSDNSPVTVPYVGAVQITLLGKYCYQGAVVFGEEVVVGSLPLSDLEMFFCTTEQIFKEK